MATKKITITLEEESLREIRALVAVGKASSVSGFVQHAVAVALFDAAGWKDVLTGALEETGGPMTKKEREWADGVLAPRGQRPGSRKGKAA